MTRFVRLSIACALLVLITLPVQAQKPYTELDAPPLPEFEIPEAERVELPNGMIVFLIEDRELPLVEMSARVGVGSVYEPAEQVGLAAITGTVMRTGGTESVRADELNERLENLGAVVETGIGEVSGSAFMSALTETVDDVLPLFVDVLVSPAFPQDQIDLAKTQQKSSIARRNDDPQSIAFREFDKLVYGADSPYARHTEYATIDAIERDDLVAFHDRFFHANNTILGVWGDFDTNEMVTKLEAAFAGWEPEEGFERPPQPPVDAESSFGVFYAPKMDVTQSTVLMGHPGEITMAHPDYLPVTVMNQVLSGFTGRLFQNVRDDQGLAYAVFGSYTANYEQPGQFYAGIMTRSETTVAGASAVLDEIEKLRAEPPGEEEVELAKDNYLNSFVFNFDTRREIVDRMTTYEYYGYPMDFLDRIREGVQQAGPEDVHRVADRYLRPDDLMILAVGNHEDFGEPISRLGAVDTLDITIPTGSGPEPEATGASIEQGQELLAAAAEALGGSAAFRAVETVRLSMTTSVRTPDGQQMSIGTTQYAAYPDRMRLEQSLPMGELIIVVNGGDITLRTPEGTMPAPGEVREQVNSMRWRDLIFLFAHAGDDELTVQHTGRQELGDSSVDVVHITPPAPATAFDLLLDADSHVPVAMYYEGRNMLTGAPARMREELVDYMQVEAVRLPGRIDSYQDGAAAAETRVEEIELDVELAEDLFTLE
jgi:predicted Zn-dependent peptidase